MRQRSSVWAFACFFISASAVAASPPGDHELIRERQEQLLQQQRQRLQELQQLPGPAPAAPAAQTSDDEPCFSVEQVEISGASLLSEADREALLAPFSGGCLGVTQLDALLRAITHHYIDDQLLLEARASLDSRYVNFANHILVIFDACSNSPSFS